MEGYHGEGRHYGVDGSTFYDPMSQWANQMEEAISAPDQDEIDEAEERKREAAIRKAQAEEKAREERERYLEDSLF